jgi:hypothetical protein
MVLHFVCELRESISPKPGPSLRRSFFSSSSRPFLFVMAALVARLSGSILLYKAHGIDSNGV